MDSNKIGLFANIIGIVAGLAALIPLYQFSPLLFAIAFTAIIIWSVFVIFQHRYRAFKEIKDSLATIEDKLKTDNFHPDLIIAFTRTSAVIAGMLAVRMKIEELLVISRRVKRKEPGSATYLQGFNVGYRVSLKTDELQDKKILIVFHCIETGVSLASAIEYLKSQGFDGDYKVVTLYITPAGRKRFPEVFAVHETSATTQVLDRLPWISGKYHRL